MLNQPISLTLYVSYFSSSPCLNPLHPNISIHILRTLLYKFPLVLTGRIRLTIKAS